jgi:hypothetical protein
VFVSFATEDRSVAQSAVETLESNGYSCWVAWRDIPDGVPYAAAIVQGIRGARVLVVVLTPESRSSPHVLREVECAVAANRPTLTVQMAGCLPGEALGYYLAPTQWLRNDEDELDAVRLVAAVRKLAKDAKKDVTEHQPHRSLPTLIRALFGLPAAILSVTGLTLVAITQVFAPFTANRSFAEASAHAAQDRSILLVMMGGVLAVGSKVENAIERRRAPYNPLRSRLVPSYAIMAGLLLIASLWIWSFASGLPAKAIFVNEDRIFLIPRFLLSSGDDTSFWFKIQTAFGDEKLMPNAGSWREGWSWLIIFVATAMALAAFAICLQKIVRSQARSLTIMAMLPFFLVRCALGFDGDYPTPSPLYWAAPVCAALLALWLRSVGRSRAIKLTTPVLIVPPVNDKVAAGVRAA